ncbi:MAG: histidine kinase [Ruminococcus sp.]|nr:histidine kinase [Ruminococcus sp.]
MFKRIIILYKSLRIQTKLTITHLVIATIPMIVLGIFLYTHLYNMVVSDTIGKEQTASMQTTPLIEEAVSKILDVHSQVTQHPFFRSVTSRYRTEDLGDLVTSETTREYCDALDSLIDGTLITDVKIYLDLPKSESLFKTSHSRNYFLPIDEAHGTYWYGIFSGNITTASLFCPSFYLSKNELGQNGDMAYITRGTMTFDGSLVPYYAAVYFSQNYFDQILKENLSSGSNVAYIINSRDSIVATSNTALSGTYHFSYDIVQESFMSSNNFISRNIVGEDVYAGFYKLKNTDWYMVVAIPSRPLIMRSGLVVFGFVCAYVACIIAALLIATFLSRSFTGRLSTVINQMAQSRSALPVALPDSDTQDEIGDLISSYNYMSHMINKLVSEQAKAAEDLRNAEFNTLQAQMNPHFLYNTMDMINWLAQQGRTNEVTTVVQKLSRFYKLTLSRKQSLSTIADELEHVSIYVDLQNMRFHDMIDFIVDVPDTLMDYSIPKLTFQPIVENSIQHGILEKEEKQGTIVLTAWTDGQNIVLLISDDGVGIPENILEHLLDENQLPARGSGSQIAVYNTHRRLQLFYGGEYGLKYKSTPGEGTEVEIRIPM